MVGFKPGKYVDDSAKVARAVRKAGWDALRRLGFLIRGQAQAEIKDEAGPSTPPARRTPTSTNSRKKENPASKDNCPPRSFTARPARGRPA